MDCVCRADRRCGERQRPTYVGVLDRTDKTRVERYLNGRASDIATIDKNTGTKDTWKHVDLVISGKTAKLYVDKVRGEQRERRGS